MAEIAQHDVVIVGGGGAGLRAAIAVAETYPDLDIGMVSKVYPMRSHTVSAEGGAAAVIKPGDSLEDHILDTISGADWLADQDAVEAFVEEAPRELEDEEVTAQLIHVVRAHGQQESPQQRVSRFVRRSKTRQWEREQ